MVTEETYEEYPSLIEHMATTRTIGMLVVIGIGMMFAGALMTELTEVKSNGPSSPECPLVASGGPP